MVRGNDDDHSGGGAALTSIALLQERFRQLQRMKELRQEKELLRTLSESDQRQQGSPPASHANHNHELPQQKPFPGPQVLMRSEVPPDKSQCQLLSLSLWPDSSDRRAGSRELRMIMEGPSNLITESWLADAPLMACTSPVKLANRGGCSDIDTSLRL